MNHIKKGLLLSLLITTSIYGYQEVYDFHNIRQKAMGGTQATTAKDSTGFYQNPALLALEKKVKLAIPRIGLGLNEDFIKRYQDYNDLQKESNDESTKIQLLKDLVPLNAIGAIDLTPILTFTKNNLGLTTFGRGNFVGKLKRKTSPTLYVQGNIEFTSQIGIAHTFSYNKKNIHIGISPKYIYKSTFYNKETGEDIFKLGLTDLIKVANKKLKLEPDEYTLNGYGLDMGALYEYETENGTGMLGISIKNLITSLSGEQKIVSGNQTTIRGIKTKEPLIITVGNNFNQKIPIIKNIEIATEYNIIAPTESNLKRIHIGIEKKLTPILAFRGGINQGFIVGGFGINLFLIKLDYAYFAEEFSNSIGKNTIKSHNFQIGALF